MRAFRPAAISVINLNERYAVNRLFVKKAVAEILRYVKIPKGAEFEIVFLNDPSMKVFNKRYKNRRRPTDVLSFRIDSRIFKRHTFIGEILISLDRARANFRLFGNSFEEEIMLYVIHGILHLAGYDDENARGRKRMRKEEERLLKLIRMTEDLSRVLTPR
jgi:probable rRNA maturation factor